MKSFALAGAVVPLISQSILAVAQTSNPICENGSSKM
jgi:hypothetical protein